MLGVASAAGRVAGTVIGVVLAGLLFVAWPTWSSGPARQALARLMDAQRAYVHAVLDSLVEGVPAREDDLRRLGRRVRLAWTKAASTVARSLAEPAPRRIDAHQSQGLLTALREISRGSSRVTARAAGRPTSCFWCSWTRWSPPPTRPRGCLGLRSVSSSS